ncbi:MAG: hypothetical protein NTV34_09190 [Proteobacteria bacterium]|nr:hypothetical protein [Pseudomonadota bacterium]
MKYKSLDGRLKKLKPDRPLRKVLASVSQVVKVQHVSDRESIWRWGLAKENYLAENFTISIWNLWKQAGGHGFFKEFEFLCDSCDLFLAQEALISRSAIALFARPGCEAVHAATYRRRDGCRDGVMTIARTAARGDPIRIISATVEPLLKTTKAALLTYYRMISDVGPMLAVVNLHSTLMRRPRTARLEMLRIIEHLENHEGPIIFGGDFNTFSKVYLREVERALLLLKIEHVYLPIDPRKNLAKLDQLFVRGLEVREIQVATNMIHSDHFPIVAKLSLKRLV